METQPLTPLQLACAFQGACDAHTDFMNQTDRAFIDRQSRMDANRQYWHHVAYINAMGALRIGTNGVHELTTVAEDAMRGLSLPVGVA